MDTEHDSILICQHCGCPGATMGYYGDAHDEPIECIEALRDRMRTQDEAIKQLHEAVRFLASGQGVERAA